jgi:hypothetical protein
MFELSEVFGRFMPSTWSKRGVVGDYFNEDEFVSIDKGFRRGAGAAAVLCASAFLAVGGMSQPVQAMNIAVPGFTEARVSMEKVKDAGAAEQYERVTQKHVQNVVEFVRRAPRTVRDITEPEPSF